MVLVGKERQNRRGITVMQSEEVKGRFGRCPYCRAMIYQDPNAVIFYCSKCRTPIRGTEHTTPRRAARVACSLRHRLIDHFFRIAAGKNPKPTDEAEYALSQLEILSADTASVFSDDVEPSNPRPGRVVEDGDDEQSSAPSWSTPYRNFNDRQGSSQGSLPYRPQLGSLRTGNRDEQSTGSPLRGRVAELRPSSRRTRRSMSGDANNGGGSGTDSDSHVPASAAALHRRRASPLSSQELDASSSATDMSGLDPAYITTSALSDPGFQKDLLQALENLRNLIAAVDQPRSGTDGSWHGSGAARMSASCSENSTRTVTRRNSRMMRRLESQLVQALPPERLPRDASTSSSSSSSASSGRRGGGVRARAHHCRPVLGGTPFVVCTECSEILQLPAALPIGRVARLQCGGCGEALSLRLPAGGSTGRPKKIFSAPQPAVRVAEDAEEYPLSRRTSMSSEQPRPAGPLHRVLGYSSVSSVLRSRRYGDEHD
jgi:ribosomal protein L37AE/L43A